MKTLEFHTLDVFTTQPFAGNPLAVVLGADGLTTAQMQTMAREFNLSETIFVQAPANPLHTAKVRIFFPTAEIPFAGHPTIGCAILLATRAHSGDFRADLVLEEEAGLVPVQVNREGETTLAEFAAPVLPHAAPGTVLTDLLAQAIDIEYEKIGFSSHRPAIWQGGPRFLYIPVADLATLATARPIEPHWSAVMQAAGVDSAYLYTPGADCDFQARMFSPTAGIPEDPATGSAKAILAAQLRASGEITKGIQYFTLRQGVEMGRPSELSLTVEASETALLSVSIKGSAVAISQGHIRVPDPS